MILIQRNKIVGLELDALGNYVYWADGNTNAIWRASILDSVVEKVFSAGKCFCVCFLAGLFLGSQWHAEESLKDPTRR